MSLDKDKISQATIQKIQKYIADPDFKPEVIAPIPRFSHSGLGTEECEHRLCISVSVGHCSAHLLARIEAGWLCQV